MRSAWYGVLSQAPASSPTPEPAPPPDPPPPPAPTYRYLRLVITANSGDVNYTGTDTLELRETVSGADAVQGSGGTASASAEIATYEASKAFDASGSTGWVQAATFPVWLEWDFGDGNAKTIAEYAIGAYPTATSTAARSFRDWTLEGSNDRASWTVLDTRAGVTGWTRGELRVYEVAP